MGEAGAEEKAGYISIELWRDYLMEAKEIIELLKYGEHINLECKKAENQLPKSVWETYSSFANTDGGIILLGVEENLKETDFNKRFNFISIQNPQQRIIEFWNTINSSKVSSNLLMDSDIGICNVNNADIIWINIPRAEYKYRPVYINENPYKGTFKRNHEGDYHCTEDEVKAMIRDANDSGNDGSLLRGFTVDDIDINSLHSYRIEFQNRHPEHVWNGLDDVLFLERMKCYALDRETGDKWLTTAGLLMFGKGSSIIDRFDNIRMDYIDTSNLVPGSRWSDRITYDGTWENNLYNFVRIVMPKLVFGIRQPFKLEGLIRVDDTPVHKAIREAVINMVIHSDYMVNGLLKIVKTDMGFEFSNPGNLKLSVQRIYEGGHSVARNPRLQTMFRMIGYGDNLGSGFPTILQAWGEEKWRKPDLQENEDLNQVELKLWKISLMPKECTEYLQSKFGWVYEKLDRCEQIILGTAYLERHVTNSRLQAILGLPSIGVGRILLELVHKNILIFDGNGRWRRYSINKRFSIPPEQIDLTIDGKIFDFKIDTDKMIYNYIKTNGFITAQQVIMSTKLTSKSGAVKALNRLIDEQLIKKVRKGRQIIYILEDSK